MQLSTPGRIDQGLDNEDYDAETFFLLNWRKKCVSSVSTNRGKNDRHVERRCDDNRLAGRKTKNESKKK